MMHLQFLKLYFNYNFGAQKNLVEDCKDLKKYGINSVGIMSNDTIRYPEDSFEKMKEFAKQCLI